MKLFLATTAIPLMLAAGASAAVSPYTETFSEGNANWADQASNPLAWFESGGADGGGYVSNTFNFVDSSPGGFPQILFRGQANLNSSDGAFVGDWLAGGIVRFSFHVRHDAPVAMNYFVRFATPGNFPSMNAVFPVAVDAGAWHEITLEINPDNPLLIPSGGPDTFFDVFGNVGNIQIGVEPDPLIGTDLDVTFDLDLVATVIPAPGALVLLGLAGFCSTRRRRH